MPVQPATRRLLTEAAGTATYVPLSSRGAANGVATLGADGKVPLNQLSGSALVAIKPADTTVTNSSAFTDDPHLSFTNVAAGNYDIELFLRLNSTAATWSGALGWTTGGYDGLLYTTKVSSLNAAAAAPSWVAAGAGNAFTVPADTSTAHVAIVSGVLYLPAAQAKLTLKWCQASASTTPTILKTGSHMRLSRIA
jgi:hypothetical protein